MATVVETLASPRQLVVTNQPTYDGLPFVTVSAYLQHSIQSTHMVDRYNQQLIYYFFKEFSQLQPILVLVIFLL